MKDRIEYIINNYFYTDERNKSKKLYESCAVKCLKISLVYEDMINVSAAVEDNNRSIRVSFSFSSYGSLGRIQCGCGKRQFYYDYCEHVGAVLYVLNDINDLFRTAFYDFRKTNPQKDFSIYQQQIDEINIESLEVETSQWTNQMKDVFTDSFYQKESVPVKLIVTFDNKDLAKIKFKVGTSKMYVIKNVYTFLNNLKFNRSASYGKNFNWVHDENSLDEYSKIILSFMRKYYNQTNNDYYDDNLGIQNNAVVLTPYIIDEVYNLLDQLPEDYRDIETIEDKRKFTFKIKEDKRGYRIEMVDDIAGFYFSRSKAYEVIDYYIVRYPMDDQTILTRLITMMIDHDFILRVGKSQISEFYQFVLRPILKYIDIETDIDFDQFDIGEDHIEIYGDVNEEAMAYFKIMACFEDEKVNVLEHPERSYSPTVNLIRQYMLNYEAEVVDYTLFFDIENNKTIELLNQGLVFLEKYADVYVSDKLRRLGKKTSFNIKVGISVADGLLSLDFDSIDIPKEELAEVLRSYHSKKKYHKLKSGEVIHIESDELEEIDDLMNQYKLSAKDMNEGHIDMNLNRAYAMNLSAEHMNKLKVHRSDSFNHIVERLNDYQSHEYDLNKHYQNILRDYQKDGYQWLSTLSELKLGGILADDMGLGKTLQVIALLDNVQENFSIVVCPSSLVLNWMDEFHKFSPENKAIAVMGNREEREAIISQSNHYDTLITSYDYLRRDIDLYKKIKFDYVVLDEAQYIKNQKTKNAQSVKKLKAKQRFALTGTPIENSLAELWSIFDFLDKDYLFNYAYFKKQYETPIVKNKDVEKQEELKQLIAPFVLRRTKKEVLKELPEKVEKTISIEFNEEEKKLYYAHLAKANKELQSLDGGADRIQILAMLTKLRQICCEPRMAFENIHHPSSKLEACLDLIYNYKENNKKIIVFSSFTSALDLMANELDKEHIKYHMLTGATNKIKRKQYVDEFQSDDSTVFLISLKAGGTGLNLTAAEGVIHFDPWWNMSAQSQATDRAHRIGQKNTVFVYKLIMSGSIEEKIQELQNRKKDLADTFVEGNEGSITSMSSEEIMDLFK